MNTTRLLALSVCLCVGTSSLSQTDDELQAEIMRHIIDPCFAHSASKSEPIAGMSEKDMVTLMKLMSPDAVVDTVDVTLPAVRGQPADARKKVYEIGLKLCIKGTGK